MLSWEVSANLAAVMAQPPSNRHDDVAAHNMRLDYRVWAEEQLNLPFFHQPQWLDLVAPGCWRALLAADCHPKSSPWAWPYVTKVAYGLEWVALPQSTPYLGPFTATSNSAPGIIHAPHPYVLATIHQACWSWTFGSALRGMSTQVIDLQAEFPVDKDLQRRIRRADQDLVIRSIETDGDVEAAHALIVTQAHIWQPHDLVHYLGAGELGIAEVFGAFSTEKDILQGIAVVLSDQRRSYLPLLARTPAAHASTSVALLVYGLDRARRRGSVSFDLMSGYLPGVRAFYERFGAQPEWYGQLRLVRTAFWRSLESIRSLTSKSRL